MGRGRHRAARARRDVGLHAVVTCSLVVAQPDGSNAQTLATAMTYVPSGLLPATGITLSGTTNRAGAVLPGGVRARSSSSSKISLGARTMAFKVA